MIRTPDFDVIAPRATALDGSYYAFTDEDDTGRRIDKILETMRRD